MNIKTLLIAALATASVGMALPALAHDALRQQATQIVALTDGSTLYVFRDGKMAKSDKFGRAVYLKDGEVLDAADGTKVAAVGNEVARLAHLMTDGHRN